eukprot:122771-Pyramimonas_sp.AAC.1
MIPPSTHNLTCGAFSTIFRNWLLPTACASPSRIAAGQAASTTLLVILSTSIAQYTSGWTPQAASAAR